MAENEKKKGKVPAKKPEEPRKLDDTSDKTANFKIPVKFATSSPSDLNSNLILECLKSIQASQSALVTRMDNFEQANAYYDDYDDYEEESVPKRARLDDSCSESEQTSRFADLSKKFKATEVCDENVDEFLADTVTEVYRKGMDPEKYENFVRDEVTPRPGNCEGLVMAKMNKLVWDVMSSQSRTVDKKLQSICTSVVKAVMAKMNKLVWDVMSSQSRTVDKKLQSICTSVVKAGVCLTKTMNLAAKMEKTLTDKEIDMDINMTEIINGCHDAMGLMGHSNYQTNMLRRDLLRPELKREYAHLCTHTLPVTQELFGDDVSKTAREIEDTAKIRDRMAGSSIQRGTFRSRSWNRGRLRGSMKSRPSPTPTYTCTNYRSTDSKNYGRRPGVRPLQKN